MEGRTRSNALFLSVVAQFNGRIAGEVVAWFDRFRAISGLNDDGYSDQRMDELRAAHNANASFFRNGDHIYISPKKGVDLSLGTTARLPIDANVRLVEQMIRHLVFRNFRDAFPDRLPESFTPLRFPSKQPQHDLVATLAPDSLRGIITFSPVNEISVRSVVENGRPVFGLLVQSRHRWRFPVTLAFLHAEGFPLEGAAVLQTVPVPGLTGVLAPDETVAGEIERLDGDVAVIRTNQSTERRPLAELYLQRSREQIGRYLAFRLGDKAANEFFQRLRVEKEQRSRQGAHFGEAVRIAGWFAKRTYENNDGFAFTVTKNSSLADSGIRLDLRQDRRRSVGFTRLTNADSAGFGVNFWVFKS